MWKKVLIGIGTVFLIIILIGILVGDGEDSSNTAATETKQVTRPAPTVEEVARPVGLGIERDAVKDAFSNFDFEDAPLRDGRERSLGEALDGVFAMELIGDDSNLEQASLMMTVNVGANDSIPGYAGRFLSTVLPDWTGGADWFEQGVFELADDSRENAEIETRHGDTRIQLTVNKRFGWLTLNIEPAEGEPQAQAIPMSNSESAPPTTTAIPATTVPAAQVESNPTATPQPTTAVQPAPTPTQDIMKPVEVLGSRVKLVGAWGNPGIVPGQYEYRDDNGNKVVQGNDCYLEVNLGDPAQKRIDAVAGQPFTYRIQHRHQNVSFRGYDGGCTGDSSVGYGLYRIGS